MLKGLFVAVAAGVVILVVTGQLRELRNDWVERVFNPSSRAEKLVQGREAFAKQTNSICTDPQQAELNIKAAIPQNRAEYVRVMGAVIERERIKQAALRRLEYPDDYDTSFTNFLANRDAALTALERLRQAAIDRNRQEIVRAMRSAVRAQLDVNSYAQSFGMPACSM